ncbi:50S ribosomal protein L21e [Candidatus Woesearchaeota archaeon]|nr:50S ribosomal protein L21e [Candidatus Woesearchaeota archaeon]
MAKRQGGFRRKSRHKLKKHYKKKGKLSITKFLQEFKQGEKVVLNAEPSYQKAMYFPRFHGKIGTIHSKRGKCYEVIIRDNKKKKIVIVHPVHLKKAGVKK